MTNERERKGGGAARWKHGAPAVLAGVAGVALAASIQIVHVPASVLLTASAAARIAGDVEAARPPAAFRTLAPPVQEAATGRALQAAGLAELALSAAPAATRGRDGLRRAAAGLRGAAEALAVAATRVREARAVADVSTLEAQLRAGDAVVAAGDGDMAADDGAIAVRRLAALLEAADAPDPAPLAAAFADTARALRPRLAAWPRRAALAAGGLIDGGLTAGNTFDRHAAATRAEAEADAREALYRAALDTMASQAQRAALPADGAAWPVPVLAGIAAASLAAWLVRRHRAPRVLLVEDEPMNRAAAAAILGGWGCAVTVAADGESALGIARKMRFDAALVDLHLPGLSGAEAIRRLRAEPNTARAVLAALTAGILPSEQAEVLGAGADAILAKPLRRETLPPVLRRALGLPESDGSSAADPGALDDEPIRRMRELLPDDRVAELIEGARTAMAELGTALERHRAERNPREAAMAAHRLAGLAGTYGCAALHGAAQALEHALDGGMDGAVEFTAVAKALPPALAQLERRRAA